MINVQKLAPILARIHSIVIEEFKRRETDVKAITLFCMSLACIQYLNKVYVLQWHNHPEHATRVKTLVGALAEAATTYRRDYRTNGAARISDLARAAYTEAGGHYDESVHADDPRNAGEATAPSAEAEVHV